MNTPSASCVSSEPSFVDVNVTEPTLPSFSLIDFKVWLQIKSILSFLNALSCKTRRAHPLMEQGKRSLINAINDEREHLSQIRSIANFVIDTTKLSPKELKERIRRYYEDEEFETFTINVTSFGFKHGIQMDADLVFDVRFLPNPYYVVDLRPLTGLDKDVYNYVMKWKETEIFFEKLTDLLDFMIPGYKKEGKSQLVIAIGCTGGQHRSVALAERLGNYLNEVFEYNVYVHHRDAHIESGEKK